MSIGKRTFRARTFQARTFASATWAGVWTAPEHDYAPAGEHVTRCEPRATVSSAERREKVTAAPARAVVSGGR